jgi:DNA-binding MarR family transcriptional regulator
VSEFDADRSPSPGDSTDRRVSEELAWDATSALSAMIRGMDGYRFRASADAQVGLTELRALGHLEDRGALSPKQLAEALDLTTGTVTALLDRLERAGLVTRSAHPRDRRMLQVELTAAGAQKMSAVMAGFHERVAAACATLPPESITAAIQLLQAVRAEILSHGAGWRRTNDAES